MVPPSIKRAWWLGGAWMALFLVLGVAQAGLAVAGVRLGGGGTRGWSVPGAVLMPVLPFVGMFGIYGAMWSVRRTLKRYKAASHGLCVRCEYPLPEIAQGETTVRCPECGLDRTREEHRRAWARWVGDLN